MKDARKTKKGREGHVVDHGAGAAILSGSILSGSIYQARDRKSGDGGTESQDHDQQQEGGNCGSSQYFTGRSSSHASQVASGVASSTTSETTRAKSGKKTTSKKKTSNGNNNDPDNTKKNVTTNTTTNNNVNTENPSRRPSKARSRAKEGRAGVVGQPQEAPDPPAPHVGRGGAKKGQKARKTEDRKTEETKNGNRSQKSEEDHWHVSGGPKPQAQNHVSGDGEGMQDPLEKHLEYQAAQDVSQGDLAAEPGVLRLRVEKAGAGGKKGAAAREKCAQKVGSQEGGGEAGEELGPSSSSKDVFSSSESSPTVADKGHLFPLSWLGPLGLATMPRPLSLTIFL